MNLDTAPTISSARYARNMMAVHCPSNDGFKSRAACLAEALRGRYSGREGAYIMSPTKAERLRNLYAAGWDANCISKKLIPPDAPSSVG